MRGGARANSPVAQEGDVPLLRIQLLGGFQVEHGGAMVAEAMWRRRQARTLLKLLAAVPSHSLHREQVVEYLWPEVKWESALNSFGKALHAARKALEPHLPPRGASSYLRLRDDILSLSAEHVWIDADYFRALGESALSGSEMAAYETALAAWTGELLPEDRYEDWAAPQRELLADLHLRLLLGLAATLERRGAFGQAIDCLNRVLQQDPPREEVHRRLMRLYAETGSRHQALMQYQTCVKVLEQELEAAPEPETEELYQNILEGQIRGRSVASEPISEAAALPPAIQRPPATPLFGRSRVMQLLGEQLAAAKDGNGSLVLVSGEIGVGKTRLAAEIAREAAQGGTVVLWGANYEQESLVPYGSFVEALEGYLATRPIAECQEIAANYPILTRLVPSLGLAGDRAPLGMSAEAERSQLFAGIVRLLTDLATDQPVLLVLDDLHAASRNSLQLVEYLARQAPQRRWLIIGTYREEDLVAGSELRRVFSATTREGLCTHMNLRRLARQDSDQLVDALLPGAVPSLALREQSYALSLGNPLFIHELVGAMQGRKEILQADGRWELATRSPASVPRQVQKLVDVRVDRLTEEVQRVLTLVAAAGPEISFTELLSAAGEAFIPSLSEEEILDMLDQALQVGILKEHGNGYAFEHPLFQAALYDNLSRPRRIRLHTALAHALEASRPDEVRALAYHYCRSLDHDKAITYLERSTEHARSVGATQAAAEQYRELIERLERTGRTEQTSRARQNMAAVLADLQCYEEALHILEPLAELYRDARNMPGLEQVTAQITRVRAAREERISEPSLVVCGSSHVTRSA